MKKSKKNFVAIVLIVLLLALAVGYAAFSETLTISGTASTQTGNWDVKFISANATASVVTGTTPANTATLAADGKSVTVSVALAAPGDGSNITAVIKNDGKIDAKLTGFTVTGDLTETSSGSHVYTSNAIKMTVPAVTTNEVLAAGAQKTFTFAVEWDENVAASTVQTASFTITFTYEQDGVEFTAAPAWN